ncbi:MAG TPA: insulinase family protein, partial [Candidatus Campbellbacteria bacterium]|nr:insulinase family protein [Candidatus Campbellbacteria bacterium]
MELNFSKTITKSGVPLWVLALPESKTVAAGVLIKAGTRDEVWPKEAGIAHALEHMFLQGTENFPTQRQLAEYIEEVGGRINAWTW